MSPALSSPPSRQAPLIAVDARLWRQSGIGRALRELLPRMLTAWPEARWRLFGNPDDFEAMPDVEKVVWEWPAYGWREHLCSAPAGWSEADLRWVPHYNLNAATRGPLVVTVYDVLPLVQRDGWRGRLRGWVADCYFDRIRKLATSVLTASEFTAGGLGASAGIGRERIKVIPLGVDERFRQAGRGRRELVWLFVGNVKPHKGLRTLLAAMELMPDDGHQVVIIGRREGFFTSAPELGAMADRLGGRVRWAGVVEDAELLGWYARAQALVLPSTHEGFGLPVLEAMASGCPVVASRAASLPEVGGDVALWFEPGDAVGLARQLGVLAGDAGLRARLTEQGRARAREFSWERAATETASALREAWQKGAR